MLFSTYPAWFRALHFVSRGLGCWALGGTVTAAADFAFVMQIVPAEAIVYSRSAPGSERQRISQADLPLALDRTAVIELAGATAVELSLPKGRVRCEGEAPLAVAELNAQLPTQRDRGYAALKHFRIGGSTRAGASDLAYPVPFSAVRAETFAVHLGPDWPAGAVELRLVDGNGEALGETIWRREGDESEYASDVLRQAMHARAGGAG